MTTMDKGAQKKTRNGSRKGAGNVPKEFEAMIQRILATGRDFTARELKEYVENDTEYNSPHDYSEKTYQRLIDKYIGVRLGTTPTNDLDQPWAVSQVNDGIILPQAMERIIAIQRLLVATGHWLTIRRVLYITRLLMLVDVLNKIYTEEEQNLILLQIAAFYSLADQMVENQLPKPTTIKKTAGTSTEKEQSPTPSPRTVYADTRETLDKTFLIDLSSDKKLFELFEAIVKEWVKSYGIFLRSKFNGKTVDYLQARELNPFIDHLIKNELDAAIFFINGHPEFRVLALRYMALSTRHDLVDPKLYYVYDEIKKT